MNTVSADTVKAEVEAYLNNDCPYPFFVVVDKYEDILRAFPYLQTLRTSSCCQEDSFPDLDALYDKLRTISSKTILLGAGESAAMSGDDCMLRTIKDILPSAKLIVLCRGSRTAVQRMVSDDPKFGQRRVCFLQTGSLYRIFRVAKELEIPAYENFRSLLAALEDDVGDDVFVKTDLPLYQTHILKTAFDAIKQKNQVFPLTSDFLSETQWKDYLKDDRVSNYPLDHWRTYLKLLLEPVENPYLKLVLRNCPHYEAYRRRLLFALLDESGQDASFKELYDCRKILLENFKGDMTDYLAETCRKKGLSRLAYLTDNTEAEREAIIETLERADDLPALDALANYYPDLADYLQDYIFTGKNGELFTRYFRDYKKYKVTNHLPDEFLQWVCALAGDGNRAYNSLNTRGSILEAYNDGNTTLFWLDALGVEYLAYIQKHADRMGLRSQIQIGRAELPSITSENREFYDSWKGKRCETKDLDDIKHGKIVKYSYEHCKKPIYLAEELAEIRKVLSWIEAELTSGRSKRVVLASDHGASRLAVINEKERKEKMASKGQHSGRCCPQNEMDVKSIYATLEKGFWVLANYDRFQGGRKASVEVHGGASLEEVVVPVICFTLADSTIYVENTTNIAYSSADERPVIELFSKTELRQVSLKLGDKVYMAEKLDEHHHRVTLDYNQACGQFSADVCENGALINVVTITIRSRVGTINDDNGFFD